MRKNIFGAKARAGFTLIELVLVIVILGILAAVALPKFISLGQEAGETRMTTMRYNLASASHTNFLAKQLLNPKAITIDGPNICTRPILESLLASKIPAEIAVVDQSGSCASPAEWVSCQLVDTSPSLTSTIAWKIKIYCAR